MASVLTELVSVKQNVSIVSNKERLTEAVSLTGGASAACERHRSLDSFMAAFRSSENSKLSFY